ncbi:hypothetical protein ANO11243_075660 [Dothideomycetidae sp. 11243]|nr:hypothetical protein ANO11243_075660 [fungal sp. No.11243]
MATPALYSQIIPPAIRHLQNLSGILTKAVQFADEKQMPHEKILEFRLIEDMRPLPYQVQSCCNTIKFIVPRLKVGENVVFPDDETTFDQLQTRISKTVELLQAIDPHKFAGKDAEPVLMETARMGNFKFESGQEYVSMYALPNFHFHFSSAYCILRHLGVPIGAFDYLGKETFVKAP